MWLVLLLPVNFFGVVMWRRLVLLYHQIISGLPLTGQKRNGDNVPWYETSQRTGKFLKKAKQGKGNQKKREKFKTEKERRHSFSNWPKLGNPSPDQLAEAGFEHTPYEEGPDCVYCERCEKYLEDWEPGDEPKEYHEKQCPFYHKGKQPNSFAQSNKKGCDINSSQDPQQSLSLILKSAIKSEFNDMKKEIQDKFDELKREIQESQVQASLGNFSGEDLNDFVFNLNESEVQDCATEVLSPSTKNPEAAEQQHSTGDTTLVTRDETDPASS